MPYVRSRPVQPPSPAAESPPELEPGSGFVASLCSTPADVAKSRIMSQTAGPDGKMPYNGTLDCWRKVVANEGFTALYKGFMPGWLRLGPWQLVFWCSYEQLRILTGIGGFK